MNDQSHMCGCKVIYVMVDVTLFLLVGTKYHQCPRYRHSPRHTTCSRAGAPRGFQREHQPLTSSTTIPIPLQRNEFKFVT